jgi:diaminopropionate ammonia-lyase
VGGLAAALCSVFWIHFREHRPCFIVVEPDKAGCLFASAVNRRPTEVAIADETIMAGLSCGEVSRLAWSILATGADGFVTISDDLVAPTMKLLGQRLTGDARVVAGESGVAGLAAVVGLAGCPRLAAASRLDRESRILVIGSEGATDPEIYNRLVGTDVSGRGHHVEGLP